MPLFRGPGSRFRGWPIPSSRCTIRNIAYLKEGLNQAIAVMAIIKLSSIFEVHRSRFRTAGCPDRVGQPPGELRRRLLGLTIAGNHSADKGSATEPLRMNSPLPEPPRL